MRGNGSNASKFAARQMRGTKRSRPWSYPACWRAKRLQHGWSSAKMSKRDLQCCKAKNDWEDGSSKLCVNGKISQAQTSIRRSTMVVPLQTQTVIGPSDTRSQCNCTFPTISPPIRGRTTNPDIYSYLIQTPSIYTGESLKSLEAYNLFINGCVEDIAVFFNIRYLCHQNCYWMCKTFSAAFKHSLQTLGSGKE